MCALNFFMKVIVALILNGCFRNIKGNGLFNFRNEISVQLGFNVHIQSNLL